MNWIEALRYGIAAASTADAPREAPDRAPLRVNRRARLSSDTAGGTLDSLLTASIYAPIAADDHWRGLDLDAKTLDRMSPAKLLELLADLSPEVADALWFFLRFGNAGWTATAIRPSGKAPASAAAQATLDGIIQAIGARHGAFDVPIGRLLLGAFLRGAFVAELVLADDQRTALDLAAPDPASISFKRRSDPQLGVVWQPGQQQGQKWIALDGPTFRYIPIDPLPGRPEGRAPAAPALFPALFLLAMLHDLRRVIQQQGYPRLDVEVVMEKLREAMPADLENDPDAFKTWVQAAIDDVSSVYESLEPDDAYVHTDVVKVNRPVGAIDSSSLGEVGEIITALERMLVRALKTMPLLLGITDGVSEANANRQFDAFLLSIGALQHLCEQLLEYLLGLALQAAGVAATVRFRFATARASERLRDAQTEAAEMANVAFKYDRGWISQEEAAVAAVGHAPDAPAPRSAGQLDAAVTVNPDPGAMK